MTETAPSPAGLSALSARLAQDLDWLELPAKKWTPDEDRDGEPILDVAVVGAGMAGLAAGAAMRFSGLDVRLFDQSLAGMEGPWVTFGRMETLRSPKQLTGPALGFPALTFRAWYEAQYGLAAWDALDKIPRSQWMDYLIWYRHVTGAEVVNRTRLVGVEDGEGAVRLIFEGPGGASTVLARHVVLATGRDGLGAPYTPDFCRGLTPALWAHSADDIDFEALKGKRVGVIGAGASAMDNAGCALEAGCAGLDLFIRRPDMPTINKGKGGNSHGAFIGYADLPDAWKWRLQHYLNRQQIPPPRDSTRRVSRHPHARFHFGSGVVDIRDDGQVITLTTPKGVHELDFLIAATGFRTDIDRRPELAALAPHARLWGDRFQPEAGQEDEGLAQSPDLSRDFAFQERTPGAQPWITRVHAFNYAATLSLGKTSGDIPGVSNGAWRLAEAIVARLYGMDPQRHLDALVAYDEPELLGDEWTDADA